MWQVSNANQLPCFVQSLPVIRDILASLVLEFRASRRWRSPRDPLLVFGTLWAPLLNTEILQRCLLGPSQPSLPLAPAWPHVERNELRKWEVSVDLKMKEKQSLSSFLIKPRAIASRRKNVLPNYSKNTLLTHLFCLSKLTLMTLIFTYTVV